MEENLPSEKMSTGEYNHAHNMNMVLLSWEGIKAENVPEGGGRVSCVALMPTECCTCPPIALQGLVEVTGHYLCVCASWCTQGRGWAG